MGDFDVRIGAVELSETFVSKRRYGVVEFVRVQIRDAIRSFERLARIQVVETTLSCTGTFSSYGRLLHSFGNESDWNVVSILFQRLSIRRICDVSDVRLSLSLSLSPK